MTRNELDDRARETVAVYRDEFPGEEPDWDSDWWSAAWEHDGCPATFQRYLGACQRLWPVPAAPNA